jgi:hypothetical protein
MREAISFRQEKVFNPPVLAGEAGTFPSTDARSTGGRPHWWGAMYATKKTTWRPGTSVHAEAESVFSEVMDKVLPAELLDVIRGSKAGTSPGHDGIGIDLIKVITDSARLGGAESSVVLAMTFIVNQCLQLGHIPRCLKEGWITLVPKVKENGEFSMEPSEMRPITVLPALGKLCTKVLADRIGNVLVAHPDVLASQQRAFLLDGYLDQCLDTVVDVIEDWNEFKKGKSPLFVLSYDQRKAYDSRYDSCLLEAPQPPALVCRSGPVGPRGCVESRAHEGRPDGAISAWVICASRLPTLSPGVCHGYGCTALGVHRKPDFPNGANLKVGVRVRVLG